MVLKKKIEERYRVKEFGSVTLETNSTLVSWLRPSDQQSLRHCFQWAWGIAS